MKRPKQINPKHLKRYWYEFADSYQVLTMRMFGEEYYKHVKIHGKLVAIRDADIP